VNFKKHVSGRTKTQFKQFKKYLIRERTNNNAFSAIPHFELEIQPPKSSLLTLKCPPLTLVFPMMVTVCDIVNFQTVSLRHKAAETQI